MRNVPSIRRPQRPGSSGAPDDWGSVQHFDVWSFAGARDESSHFGRMPPQVVENLLVFADDAPAWLIGRGTPDSHSVAPTSGTRSSLAPTELPMPRAS